MYNQCDKYSGSITIMIFHVNYQWNYQSDVFVYFERPKHVTCGKPHYSKIENAGYFFSKFICMFEISRALHALFLKDMGVQDSFLSRSCTFKINSEALTCHLWHTTLW